MTLTTSKCLDRPRIQGIFILGRLFCGNFICHYMYDAGSVFIPYYQYSMILVYAYMYFTHR